MSIQELLQLTITNNASDLHLVSGVYPALRIDGKLSYITTQEVLNEQSIENLVFALLTPEQKELLVTNKELDFSCGIATGSQNAQARFRVNAYYEKGTLAGAFRYLPPNIRTLDQLGLPQITHSFAKLKQGLVLVTGPTGQGKSTTLAAVVNEINLNEPEHILTIEDPIEYIYPPGKSIISQREIGIDTHSWAMALRSALREDPDVVLVGEMRDPETIGAALTIAETGHLVLSTLHTNSAAQSIDRIVDSFPPHQQVQIRIQLAATLKGIVSQRLLPKIEGGRVPAVEILIGTNAVSSNIREGKTHLIDSVIQTSHDVGMMTMEASLAALVLSGQITLETAKLYAVHQEEFLRLIGK